MTFAAASSVAPAAGFFALFGIFGAVAIVSIVLFVVALIDMVRRPDWQWKLAGQEKVLWIILLCLVNAFGIVALIYWFNIRKKLVAVEQAVASGQYPSGYVTGAAGPLAGAYATPPGTWHPGWYPDPAGGGGRRWWDGRAWTQHVQPGQPPAGSPPPGF